LFSHPLRLKLHEHLIEPDSASGLARRLGIPRQVLNYHLKALEGAGLVRFVVERPRGGLKERVVRAAASSFLISPEVMGAVGPDPKRLQDRFAWAYLVAAAARVVRDLGIPRGRADRASKRLATFTLETEVRFASAADRDAFTRELTEKMAELAVRYHDERAQQGRLFRFMLGAYPAITKTDAEAAAESVSLPSEEPGS
jgi:DNA-binding transcriptional ArsR family regulator